MENEKDNIIESQNNETELDLELEETPEAPAPETTIEKPVETQEAKLARLKRQTSQLEKKLGVAPEVKQEPKSPSSDELGFAEEAYLLANEIKKDEIPLAQEILKKTGMNLRELVEDDYFKSKLKAFREEKASSGAIPKGTKRSAPSPKDSVDYWLNKPFAEVPNDMRLAVVNAKLEREKSKNPFASN
jgi:hypothetical protein